MTKPGGTAATRKRRRPRAPPTAIKLTHEQVEEIASEAAEQALTRLLLTLGIDTTSADGVLNAQRDFQHVRSWRKSTETIKRQGLMSAIGVITIGLLALIWQRISNTTGPP